MAKALLQHCVRVIRRRHLEYAIRHFNNHQLWVDGAGDAVGAVRDVLYRGKRGNLGTSDIAAASSNGWAIFDCARERDDE